MPALHTCKEIPLLFWAEKVIQYQGRFQTGFQGKTAPEVAGRTPDGCGRFGSGPCSALTHYGSVSSVCPFRGPPSPCLQSEEKGLKWSQKGPWSLIVRWCQDALLGRQSLQSMGLQKIGHDLATELK